MDRIVSWQLPDGYYAYMGQETGNHVRYGKLDDDKAMQSAKKVAQYTDKEYSDEYDALKAEVSERFPDIVMGEIKPSQTANNAYTVLMLDSDGLVTKNEIDGILSSKVNRLVADYQKAVNNYVDNKMGEVKNDAEIFTNKTDEVKSAFGELKNGFEKKITALTNQAKECKSKLSDLTKTVKSYEVVKDWYDRNKELSVTDINERYAALEEEYKRLSDDFANLKSIVSGLPTKEDLTNAVKNIQVIGSNGNSIKVDDDGIWLKLSGMDEYRKIKAGSDGKIIVEQ